MSISVVTIRPEARSLRDACCPTIFDIWIFLRDVFTAAHAVNNGLNRRAVHQQHFAFAAHLAEQIFAGGFAGWMALVAIAASSPWRRIDRDNDNSGGFCPLNGRLDAGLIDGGNNDQIHFLLNKGVNLRVLVC